MRNVGSIVPTLLILLIITLSINTYAQVTNQTETSVIDLISEAIKEPRVAIALAIQFFLGLGLGYVSAKVLKYIVAFIVILVLGMMLNVWSIGGASSTEEALRAITEKWREVWPLLKDMLTTLGIMTVGPVSIGFILGALIAFMRK